MGGKGIRRREKNFRAAHGGFNSLPPPPKASQFDALPSKLRKLISTSPSSFPASIKITVETHQKRGKVTAASSPKKPNQKDKFASKMAKSKEGGDDEHVMLSKDEDTDVGFEDDMHEKTKKKKKRKRMDDRQFEREMNNLGALGVNRKERKKKFLQEKKKKKNKKANTEGIREFPGREKIKFGEVVQAPPKLPAITKASKTTSNAIRERLRTDAIEAYRNRKGLGASRLGIHLPSPVTASPPV